MKNLLLSLFGAAIMFAACSSNSKSSAMPKADDPSPVAASFETTNGNRVEVREIVAHDKRYVVATYHGCVSICPATGPAVVPGSSPF